MIRTLAYKLYNAFAGASFQNLEGSVIELNNFNELKKVFGWKEDPILDRTDIYDFDYVEDVNERRIRDAESLATVMRNVKPRVALEIGTSTGMSTTLMAANSSDSQIYTINIPPEEIVTGEGGVLTTITLERENIGTIFKQRNINNITQILVNTAKWQPNIGKIDLAYIDGCHDTEFVYKDTRKILPHMNQGGFIIWHDFNPELVKKYNWINSVCNGVEKLYCDGLLSGRIYHIIDSWVGIYRVGS